jgi:hypothetical protein
MIWTTWRQHRAEATVGSLILACLAAGMIVVGSVARDRARGVGLPGCASHGGGCDDALSRLHDDFHSIPPFISALIAVPLLAGMFWAAPLVSREYEAGTHRLAWTQSVSPLRWIITKIALTFGAVATAALALGLLATWTLDPLNAAFGGRHNSTWYDIQGVVPVACMLFAVAVGVAASALIRRTIPAMAVTLVVYAAARIPIHWIRWDVAPVGTRTFAIPLTTLLSRPTGSPQDFASSAVPSGAWLHNVVITDPTGHLIGTNTGNFDLLRNFCPDLQIDAARTAVLNPGACAGRIQNLALRETISYQSASHFWLVQAIESVAFVGLAGLIVTVAVLAVNRHRVT